MKKIFIILVSILLTLNAQALFEIKDANDSTVVEVANDGLRIFNNGDTLMVISSTEIKAFIDDSAKDRALSRSFSITTSTASGKLVGTNVFEVGIDATTLREGVGGDQYTIFSPENIFIGLNSGINSQTGAIDNVFLGNQSGYTNNLGSYNVFIGKDAGFKNSGDGTYLNGQYNVFLGYMSGYENNSGSCNVFLGEEAGRENTTGLHNIYIGTETGRDNIDGTGNTAIGSDCFWGGSGSFNTYLGHLAGQHATGSRNVFIGTETGGASGSLSNALYIDNSPTNTPLIYGEFDNDLLRVNGALNVTGIGTFNSNATVLGNLGVGTSPSTNKIYSVDTSTSSDNAAVYGIHSVTDYYGIGVQGVGRYRGVLGQVSSAAGDVAGVYGSASGEGTGDRYGVYGYATGGETTYAGYFSGDVNVTGTISKGAGSFKIDHPLDPENKYLYHSFVESPDMKNIYDGVVVLNSDGEASVTLPEWFDTLNDNFRYQLTPIGAPGPSLYIAAEIINNEFKIAGGTSGMKVSWMVTGIRKDKFAEANRIPIEEDKTEEDKGYYLHPSAFGKSANRSIDEKNREKNRK